MKFALVAFLVAAATPSDSQISHDVVGRWKFCQDVGASNVCTDVTHQSNKTFKGQGLINGSVVWCYEGTWRIYQGRFFYTLTMSTTEKIPIGIEKSDQVLEIDHDHLIASLNHATWQPCPTRQWLGECA